MTSWSVGSVIGRSCQTYWARPRLTCPCRTWWTTSPGRSRQRLSRVQSAVNKLTLSSNPQARAPPAGHVRESPTDQTPSGPGRKSAQPGSLPVTSARVRATIQQPAPSAHIVGVGATKATKARNALKVRRSPSRRSAPCTTCVPPSSAVSLRVCSA